MSTASNRGKDRVQLSVAGIVIGLVGCVIITASSVYTALKMGALPWPTIFTSITALVLLRAFGHKSLNEANVTQIIMSAGSMVAGGIAFTIPGIWMLGLDDQVSPFEIGAVALAGTLLGLVACALIRKRFVDESDLEYPIGTAAAQTLTATQDRGGTGKRLFGSMGLAGLYCIVRDVLGWIPAMLVNLPIPGIVFGIYNSPMMLSVGFLVGTGAVVAWFAGALVQALIAAVLPALGALDVAAAQGIVSSLGMGLMMGSGIAVVLKDILPRIGHVARGSARGASADGAAAAESDADKLTDISSRQDAGLLALFVAAAALIACFVLGLGPVPAVVIVLFSFVTAIMSAQSVGQTGIDPMEIFGLIVLLIVAAISDLPQVKLFYVAGIIAVACGLGGDVMSDFKTGAIIGTNPRSMWVGQVIGALLGVVVSTVVLCALAGAYGTDAFGPGKDFVAAQASVVATMVSGVPSLPAFIVGLVGGLVLYFAGLPAMMIGLGVYLPFYMSFTASLGAAAKLVYDRVQKSRGVDATRAEENGIVVASGLLGGESIVSVVVALLSVAMGLLG